MPTASTRKVPKDSEARLAPVPPPPNGKGRRAPPRPAGRDPGRLGGDPGQAQGGRAVRAGAEGRGRVGPDDLPGGGGRLMPGGHDPEVGRDLHRRELRLCQPYPVFVGYRRHRAQVQVGRPALRQQDGRRLGCQSFGLEQRAQGGGAVSYTTLTLPTTLRV